MTEIRRVGVLGCGLMGSGIAQACATAGYETVVREVSEELISRGMDAIARGLQRAVEKDRMSAAERDRALERITATIELTDLAGCDLVIEAVVEDLEVKNSLWRELEGICAEDAIFASNTSSLPISEMAASLRRPDRLVGLHFFNPVAMMPLVEVVRTIATDPSVFETAVAFARSLGKETIECKDRSGFVVNLLLVPFMMDAIRAVEQGVASIEDIDRAMRLGAGHPMGPLALCDFVGLDTLDRIGEIMFREYREKRYASPPLLKRMVALGYVGKKAGRGFYDYTKEPVEPVGGIGPGS
ncbi:MAG TPA: 3-hydroxybutyryl-CoA dehydrogenase [Longimicrobiaceae bacterium]